MRATPYSFLALCLGTAFGAAASTVSAATVAGRVINADGGPVANAEVTAADAETQTGERGRFRVTGLSRQQITLEATQSLYGSATRTVTPPQDGLLVYLEPGDAEVLAPVAVTGTPVPGAPLLQAADVDVVDEAEKRRNESASLGDSLDQLAGVNNISTGNTVGKPVIRGLSGERVQVLSDGIAVDHQQFGVRHMPTVDPFLAGRMEVVRGANSVLYGSSALGGAVNVLPLKMPFGQAFGGEALAGYRTNNAQWDTGLTLGGGSDEFAISAGIIRHSADNIETPDEPAFFPPPPPKGSGNRDAPAYTGDLDFTDFEQINGRVGAGWQSDAYGTWTVRYSRWDDEHNFLLPPPGGNKPPSAGQEGVGQFIDNQQLQVDGEIDAGGITWKPQFVWQNNRRRSNAAGTPRAAGFDDTIDIEFDQYTARLEGEHGPVSGLDGGTFGVEYTTKNQTSRGSTQLSPGGSADNVAAFAFEEKSFGPVLLQAGLRFDHHEVEGKAGKTANPSASVVNADGNDYNVVTGSLGGTYALSEHVALAANVERGFRAPSLFELYVAGKHGGVAAVQEGNPDLDAETSLNTDLALRWASPRMRLAATVYRNKIDDYIFIRDTDNARGGLPVFDHAQGDAELTGVEFALDRTVTEWLSVNLTAEAIDGELDESGDDLPLLPADNVRAGLELSQPQLGPLRKPYLSMTARYAASKDAAPGEPFSQFDGAPFGRASTDSYTRVDLGAGFTAGVMGRAVTLDLAVTNLFDNDYRDFLDTYKGYALSPGRDIRLTARVPFGD